MEGKKAVLSRLPCRKNLCMITLRPLELNHSFFTKYGKQDTQLMLVSALNCRVDDRFILWQCNLSKKTSSFQIIHVKLSGYILNSVASTSCLLVRKQQNVFGTWHQPIQQNWRTVCLCVCFTNSRQIPSSVRLLGSLKFSFEIIGPTIWEIHTCGVSITCRNSCCCEYHWNWNNVAAFWRKNWTKKL